MESILPVSIWGASVDSYRVETKSLNEMVSMGAMAGMFFEPVSRNRRRRQHSLPYIENRSHQSLGSSELHHGRCFSTALFHEAENKALPA